MTHALNSGALNVVPFPAAEQGSSIIELLGTVEVTASIATIRLRVTAGAATAPTANCTGSLRMKIGLGAATQAAAACADITARSKVKNDATGTASAYGTAGYIVKLNSTATATPSAVCTATSYQITKRSATVVASGLGSATGYKYAYRSATTVAQAVQSAITTKRKTGGAGSTVGSATGSASIILKNRLSATVAPTASTSGFAYRIMRLTPLGTPSGIGSASAILKIYAAPVPVSPSATVSSGTKMKFGPGATATPSAVSETVNIVFKLHLGASTEATAIAYAAGSDFASKLPAPLERQIVVPPYDRTMKVVA